jgi:hypothetical protein
MKSYILFGLKEIRGIFPFQQFKFPFLVVFYTLFFSHGYVQAQDHFTISGRVVNSQTGKPVEFATVCVLNQSVGVITNDMGEFTFKLPLKYQGGDLCVSSIGFKNYTRRIQEIIGYSTSCRIELTPNVYKLKEIAVLAKRKRMAPEQIVEKAIDAIPDNYSNQSFLLKGYYRDYLKNQGEYINLLEAALEIEDQGFGKRDFETTRYKLLQTRIDDDYDYDRTKYLEYDNKLGKFIPGVVLQSFGGNELSVLRAHDPVRNANRFSFSFINCLKDDFLNNHLFTVDSVTVVNDQYVYCIGFEYQNDLGEPVRFLSASIGDYIPQKGKIEKYNIRGKIYISASNYSILKIVYTNYFKNRNKRKGKIYEMIVEYKEYKKKMYLNYLSFSNYFEMRDYSNDFYFRIEDAVYKDDLKQLVLKFNNKIDQSSALKNRNYKVRYKGKRIPIEKIRLEDSKTVILHFDYFQTMKHDKYFTFDVSHLVDVKGNEINRLKTVPMYQFRELFVNEVKLRDFNPISYHSSNSKIRPLYLQKKADNHSFWDSYNYVRNQPLQK